MDNVASLECKVDMQHITKANPPTIKLLTDPGLVTYYRHQALLKEVNNFMSKYDSCSPTVRQRMTQFPLGA